MSLKKVLVFVAAGLSTRMGGFPKGLAAINGVPVIINAINNAQAYFDDIYIICNFKTEEKFKSVLDQYNCTAKLRPINTGKGDAESVLKSVLLVQDEILSNFDCTFCWGDAFFASEIPFQYMMMRNLDTTDSILVGCAIDRDPYAYFDIYTENGNFSNCKIKKSYFRKISGPVVTGVHDQCIFRCSSDKYIELIRIYQQYLGYNGEDYINSQTNEMGLLNSFAFFNEIGKDVKVILMPSDHVYSFNTTEELKEIEEKINKF